VFTQRREKLFGSNRLDQRAAGTEESPVPPHACFSDDDGDTSSITSCFDDVAVDSHAVFSKKYGGVSTGGEEAGANLIDRHAADEFDRQHR